MWDQPMARKHALRGYYDAVWLYSGDKHRSNTSHPHISYQFFFGWHNAYRMSASTYVPHKPGKGADQVRQIILYWMTYQMTNLNLFIYLGLTFSTDKFL